MIAILLIIGGAVGITLLLAFLVRAMSVEFVALLAALGVVALVIVFAWMIAQGICLLGLCPAA
jgi:hypothetical protein